MDNPAPARLWDTASGEPRAMAVPFRVSRDAAAFHPSGRFLALGSYDEHARLWSAAVHKPLGPPVLQPGRVRWVAFDPAGRLLVTAGADRAVRIWNVPETVTGPPGQVRTLVEVLTGMELDEASGTRALAAAELQERRDRLGAGTAAWPP